MLRESDTADIIQLCHIYNYLNNYWMTGIFCIDNIFKNVGLGILLQYFRSFKIAQCYSTQNHIGYMKNVQKHYWWLTRKYPKWLNINECDSSFNFGCYLSLGAIGLFQQVLFKTVSCEMSHWHFIIYNNDQRSKYIWQAGPRKWE